MPRDDVPASRAEELQDQTRSVNVEDRAELAQRHGIPADTDRDAGRVEGVPAPENGGHGAAARGPDGRRAKEITYLARHRERMDNDALRTFLAGESTFHADLEAAEGFTPFSDREETFLLQHRKADLDVLAEELERDPAQVRAKLHLMGLQDR